MYYRKCPKCNVDISYNFNFDKLKADRKNCFCAKCCINPAKFKKGNETFNRKPIYECWVNKYGKEIADIKFANFKKKQSDLHKGEKNSMYNKPSPTGSGNGWSGWYKGWYFRSLLELSYMINIIERFNLKWKNAECNILTIPYIDYKGDKRTYRADFLINDRYLVDCKPKKLQLSINNLLKKEAAEKFCLERNMIFKYSEIPKLTFKEVENLYKENKIKFLEKYDKKFKSL